MIHVRLLNLTWTIREAFIEAIVGLFVNNVVPITAASAVDGGKTRNLFLLSYTFGSHLGSPLPVSGDLLHLILNFLKLLFRHFLFPFAFLDLLLQRRLLCFLRRLLFFLRRFLFFFDLLRSLGLDLRPHVLCRLVQSLPTCLSRSSTGGCRPINLCIKHTLHLIDRWSMQARLLHPFLDQLSLKAALFLQGGCLLLVVSFLLCLQLQLLLLHVFFPLLDRTSCQRLLWLSVQGAPI